MKTNKKQTKRTALIFCALFLYICGASADEKSSVFEQVECLSQPRKAPGNSYHYHSEPLEEPNRHNLCQVENYMEYFLCKQYISYMGQDDPHSKGYADVRVVNKGFMLMAAHAFCGPAAYRYMREICDDLRSENSKIDNISNVDTNFIEDMTKTNGVCPMFF